FPFYRNHGSLSKRELAAVVPNAESFLESKCPAEPGGCGPHVIVREFWNNHARGHGTIHGHVYAFFPRTQKNPITKSASMITADQARALNVPLRMASNVKMPACR